MKIAVFLDKIYFKIEESCICQKVKMHKRNENLRKTAEQMFVAFVEITFLITKNCHLIVNGTKWDRTF